MTIFDNTQNPMTNGIEIRESLKSLLKYLSIHVKAQKEDVFSGEVNRIPFYFSNEDIRDIQANMEEKKIMLVALPDDAGSAEIWVVSRTDKYPLKRLIGSGGSTIISGGIENINNVKADKSTGTLRLAGDTNIGIEKDEGTHTITINATAIRKLVDSKLASITAGSSNITITGDTDKHIDINI
ncbi:MAG: hypothetical protein KAH32_04095, partial [Chlamydiia bacterium]|nr:hypothetical protein [Chlamydiia bacterium]